MLLESLLKLVETLRERIDEHQDALEHSEALTRYALIDPMLRELGWDTENPAVVRPEHVLGDGRTDYALMKEGKDSPIVVIEAKSLNTSLGAAADDMAKYLFNKAVPYFAVTDGQRWEIYKTHMPVDLPERLVDSLDLKGQSPAQVCLKALTLWRPSVESGYVAPGSTPVAVQDNSHVAPDAMVTQQPTPLDDHEWQPLSELNPAPKSAPPTAVRFPDKSTAATTAWNAMLVETVRWLMGSQHLSTTHCPIQLPGSRRYVVADRPIHPEDKKFFAGAQVGSLYVEKNLNLSQMVDATRFIVTRVGQDPSQFKVRFSAST